MVAQRFGGAAQVALTVVFEVEADEVDDASTGFLDIRAQVLGTEILGDLHHSFRCVVEYGGQSLRIDDPLAHAVDQCLLEERSIVENGDLAAVARREV